MADLLNEFWGSRKFQRWILPIFIFLIAFLPRVIYPVSRPHQWHHRAYRFADAILTMDWAATFQRYHPGVSLMWLSSVGVEIFDRLQGNLTADQFYGYAPVRPGVLPESVFFALVPLAIGISVCIALTYPLMSHLAGRRIALVGVLLMALDPFLIAYGKVIHVDALLASLMMVSALFLLLYLKDRRLHNLVFSAIFAGLSFLSKSPSVFLILYSGLVVTIGFASPAYPEFKTYNGRQWVQLAWSAIKILLLWFGISIVVFFVLFPAMWVMPGHVLSEMADSLIFHAGEPHKNPVYFLGRLWLNNPGLLFEVTILAWKTTALTLLLLAAAVIFGVYHRREARTHVLWALIAYTFFFTLQMGLASKKQMAYLAPAFPPLSLIAAFGLVWTAEAISRLRQWRLGQWQPLTLLVLAILLQAILVFRHHPYYGAHHNLLLGGSTMAARILPIQDQGEGLDLAAQYLNQLPHGQATTATVFRRNAVVFEREFNGRSTREMVPGVNYRVYDINSVMRQFQGEQPWNDAWIQDQADDPLVTFDLDGVTYVWVYGQVPTDPVDGGFEVELDYRIGDQVQLTGARLSDNSLAAGEILKVALLWKATGEINDDWTVFTHILSADRELVGQQDNVPLLGIRPTYTWVEGELLEDPYGIVLEETLAPGSYELSVGMYDTDSLARIPAFDAAGNRMQDDRIVIGFIEVVKEQ